jgi:NAD(P)-dependent dehydrogenase (short-subunit alcohol dehydrogenase family)
VVDVNAEGANATAAALNDKQAAEDGQPPRAVAAIVDISQEALVSAFMDQVQATDGQLDVLVNNAARFVLKR